MGNKEKALSIYQIWSGAGAAAILQHKQRVQASVQGKYRKDTG
jgi:hypothetical protein